MNFLNHTHTYNVLNRSTLEFDLVTYIAFVARNMCVILVCDFYFQEFVFLRLLFSHTTLD